MQLDVSRAWPSLRKPCTPRGGSDQQGHRAERAGLRLRDGLSVERDHAAVLQSGGPRCSWKRLPPPLRRTFVDATPERHPYRGATNMSLCCCLRVMMMGLQDGRKNTKPLDRWQARRPILRGIAGEIPGVVVAFAWSAVCQQMTSRIRTGQGSRWRGGGSGRFTQRPPASIVDFLRKDALGLQDGEALDAISERLHRVFRLYVAGRDRFQ